MKNNLSYYLKNNLIVLIVIIVLVALGSFFIMVSGENFIKIFSYLGATYLTIIGIYLIVSAFKYKRYLQANHSKINSQIGYIIQGILLLGLATLIILFPSYLVRIFIGVTLILLPTVQLFFKENKKSYFIGSIWKYIIGIIFLLAVEEIIQIVFIVIGVIFYLLAIYLIYLLVINYKYLDKPNIVTKYFIAYIIRKNSKE